MSGRTVIIGLRSFALAIIVSISEAQAQLFSEAAEYWDLKTLYAE